MTEVIEITSAEQLEELRLVWQALLLRTRDASFFQSLDWLQAFWRHFSAGKKLRLLVVYRGREPIGILPLMVTPESTRVGRIRVLTYPLHDWGSFYGPLGPYPAATLLAGMRHVRSTPRDWDLFDLRWIDRDSSDCGRTPTAAHASGLPGREQVWKLIPTIDTNCSWEGYLASRPAKFRRNVRRTHRLVDELGQVRFERYRPASRMHGDGDPGWDLYDECVDLAHRSWQGSSRDGTTLSHQLVHEFFRDTHLLAAAAGAVDVSLLRLNERPIAFAYCYHWNGHVIGLRMGYDPEYSKVCAGSALYAHLIQDSCRRRDRLIDLGPEYLDVKRPWQTRICRSYRYTHYPLASVRSQLLRLKHWSATRKDDRTSEIHTAIRHAGPDQAAVASGVDDPFDATSTPVGVLSQSPG